MLIYTSFLVFSQYVDDIMFFLFVSGLQQEQFLGLVPRGLKFH